MVIWRLMKSFGRKMISSHPVQSAKESSNLMSGRRFPPQTLKRLSGSQNEDERLPNIEIQSPRNAGYGGDMYGLFGIAYCSHVYISYRFGGHFQPSYIWGRDEHENSDNTLGNPRIIELPLFLYRDITGFLSYDTRNWCWHHSFKNNTMVGYSPTRPGPPARMEIQPLLVNLRMILEQKIVQKKLSVLLSGLRRVCVTT